MGRVSHKAAGLPGGNPSARLSQTLFTRQRIRIKAEEDVGDIMGDLLDRVMVQTSPSVRGQGYSQVGGKVTATGAAMSSLGKSGTDVRSPVALIVVPTRELGVQIALLLFELVGGNKKKTATERSGRKNMFKVSSSNILHHLALGIHLFVSLIFIAFLSPIMLLYSPINKR